MALRSRRFRLRSNSISQMGHSRRYALRPNTSGLPPTTDIQRPNRLVSKYSISSQSSRNSFAVAGGGAWEILPPSPHAQPEERCSTSRQPSLITRPASTGKSLLIFGNRVKPRNQKYFAFAAGQITFVSARLARQEGRLAIVTKRAAGCGGRGCAFDERRKSVR